ncbi:MAG: chemotaxis protein CheA [Deltaproteobacteria bacterium]|nr:chemotaxis protein CheA [Deltaproteobacteria bacterium]
MSPSRPVSDAQSEFLVESGDLVDRINARLLALAELPPGASPPPETLNEIFRAAHSLKGLAGMFGFPLVSGLSHELESLLDSLRLGRLPLDRDVVDVLFDGVDLLTTLLEKRESDPDASGAMDELTRRLARLREGEREVDRARIFVGYVLDPALLAVLSEYEQHRLGENLTAPGRAVWEVKASFDLMTFDTGLLAALEELRALGEVVASVPDPEVIGGDSIGFKILVGTALDEPEARARLGASGRRAERVRPTMLGGAPSAPPPEAAASVDRAPAAPASPVAPRAAAGSAAGQAIRVDLPRLDAMLSLASELLLSRAEIGRLAEDLRTGQAAANVGGELWRASQLLERRLRSLEELILDIRMVSLERLFERLGRVVWRVAGDLRKDVELVSRGAETRLDKLIVDGLADPLMHLIRNSIDHGLEPGEERAGAGKRAKGQIVLEARQQGGHVLISVEDDGRGIDWTSVRAKAAERGWLGAAAEPGPDELVELLFRPGFSTRDVADEVSGRGVGLDVVRSDVDALHGTVRVDSRRGAGTRVTLTVPMTLARVRALIVGVGDQSYALPLDAIERSVALDDLGALGDEPPALVDLATLLDVPARASGDEPRWVVVLALGRERVGVVVDAVEGQQDVVVREVGPLVSGIRGIAGAAEVGEGRTLLLLEPTVLLAEGARAARPGGA